MTPPPPDPVTRPATQRANAVAGAGLLLALVALGGAVGGLIAGLIPCSGFLCTVGNAVLGAAGGALLGALIAALIGRRLGLPWWFVPLAVLIAAAGLWASGQQGLLGRAGLFLALAAPAIAAVAASRQRPRTKVALIVGLLVLVGLLGVGRGVLADRATADAQAASAQRLRQSGVPILAPTGRPELRVRVASVEPTGPAPSVMYDVTDDGGLTWARVHLVTGPDANSCARRQGSITTGSGSDAVTVAGRDVCRAGTGVVANLWPDTGTTWTTERLVQLARDLRPDDGAWIASHLLKS